MLATDRRDLLLVDDDLVFVDGDFAFVSGAAAVGQAIKFALQLRRGEWFLDAEAGTPWLQDILGRKLDATLARSILLERVTQVENVDKVQSFSLRLEGRTLRVRYEVLTAFGPVSDETEFAL